MLKNKKLMLTLTIFALMIGGVLFWKVGTTSSTTNSAEFNQKLNNAFAEINFPNSNNAVAINASTENLANFIHYRSGVQLSQANKDSLQQTEQLAWNQSKRISPSQLANVLTNVAFEKLVTLSDSDIESMAESFRGFNPSGGLPSSYQGIRDKVKPRANGEGAVQPAEFISEMKAYRDAFISNEPSKLKIMTRTALHNRITYEISTRVGYIQKANPNFFNGSTESMTPMQALLMTYSIVSDDMLVGNQVDLQQKKTELQQMASQFGTESYPSSQGHNAYGANGYIYSSPTDLLLDDSTVSRIITLIKQEAGL